MEAKTREDQERLNLEDPETYAGQQEVNFWALSCLKQADGDPLIAEQLVPYEMVRGYRKGIIDTIWDIAGK